MKYYIKIITGFREDQQIIIPMQEAHKGYYLFDNPEQRGVFNNGVALIGKNIQQILPAWNETLGYNPLHQLDTDDWNEIKSKGVDKKMQLLIEKAKDVSRMINEQPKLLKMKLEDVLPIIEKLEISEATDITKNLSEKFKLK